MSENDDRFTNDDLRLWAKYEDIAMHFNDLILRWRLQAIGGVAALVTLAGFVMGDTPDEGVRYRAMLIFSLTFFFSWLGRCCH